MKNKLLIYSQAITGHNLEYIEYLYEKVKKDKIPTVIATNNKIENNKILSITNSINIISFDNASNLSIVTKKLNTLCDKEKITHVLFMQLNILLLPRFLKLNKTCVISTIYFEHFVRYNIIKKFRFWARGIRYISPLVFNNRVKNIFVLNDKFGVNLLNLIYIGFNKFKFLSDPIDFSYYSNNENIVLNLRQTYNINLENKIITCIGSLDSRKNTVAVINALTRLNSKLLKKITLVIFGKAETSENKRITSAINEVRLKYQIQIVYENKRISKKTFNDIFFQSDIIAMPYKGHVGSSGILGHAVKYNKFVLGGNEGLSHELIKKHNLGFTANPLSEKSIAESLEKMLNIQSNKNNSKNYINEQEPTKDAFLRVIFENLNLSILSNS